MTASRKVIPFERKNSEWIKPAVVALCLVAVGFGAITVADVAATRPHPSSVSAASEAASGAGDSPVPRQAAVRMNDEYVTTASLPLKSSDLASGPRECQPYEGVNDECIYN